MEPKFYQEFLKGLLDLIDQLNHASWLRGKLCIKVKGGKDSPTFYIRYKKFGIRIATTKIACFLFLDKDIGYVPSESKKAIYEGHINQYLQDFAHKHALKIIGFIEAILG